MATQAAAALLDELMGRTRNVLPQERNQKLSWDSPEVRGCPPGGARGVLCGTGGGGGVVVVASH